MIVEVGVGFNTPSVIRWPMEGLAAKFPHVRLIRINEFQPQIPEELNIKKAVGIALDAHEAVNSLWDSLNIAEK